jgi:hypothetical protein
MQLKAIAALSLAAVLTTAPQAFAFWGGGSHHSADSGGSFSSVTGLASGGSTVSGGSGGAVSTGSATLSTPEPFAALAVGLGLVGARLLKRRR